jgi:hypothetical protein
VRLSRLPVATISEIRGRTRGAGSEFVLATDIRFASEKAILGQFEVGVGAVPGGGPMARLGGRGRALEILLGGDDIPAGLAAEYGYVNRLLSDAEIEGFTDDFARRISAFDKVAVAGIKKLVDVATLPEDDEFATGCRRTSPLRAARRACRSPSSCSRTASSNPTVSRPTSVSRSGTYDKTPSLSARTPSEGAEESERRHRCHSVSHARAPGRGDHRLRDGDRASAR